MSKNIVFFLLIVSAPVFGMVVYENPSLLSIQDQLAHIRAQMIVLKRAWNTARIRVKMAEKAAPQLYQSVKNTLDKIIASDTFTAKLNETVESHYNSIVNNNMSFDSIKTEFNLSDFFSNVTIHDFGKKLFSALANKIYCLELGKKLAQRMQELQLAATITTSTTTAAPMY